MFQYHHMRQRFGLSGPVVAVIATIILLICLTGISLWHTAAAADRIDEERTTLALRNAISSHVEQIGAIATDNALWDDGALALTDPAQRLDFAIRTWLDTTTTVESYDGVFAVDADANELFSIVRGEVLPGATQRLFGSSLRPIINRAASTNNAVGGLVSSQGRIRLIGVRRVHPTTRSVQQGFPSDAPFLIFSLPLSDELLDQVASSLVLDRVHLHPSGDDHGISLTDVAGVEIGRLHWESTPPGQLSLARSAPFMAAALLAALIAAGFLLRRSYFQVNELNRVALLDPLSDLPNRRALRNAMHRAKRRDVPMALAFVDLDGFKSVNDNFGHAVGDQLIRQCADLVRCLAPQGGMAARLGGDEFAILARGNDAEILLQQAVKQLLDDIQKPFTIGERTIAIGASVGMASGRDYGDDATEMMRHADIAMYAAKREGKSRSKWFTVELERDRAASFDMEQRLRSAITAQQLSVHYQPVIDVHSGGIIALEALLRWEDENGHRISPEAFIPVAEESGLIDKLGIFVLERACRDGLRWPEVTMSVNVSAAQLRNPEFSRWLASVLTSTGFPPSRLMLEITETYVIHDAQMAGKILKAIQRLGVRVALDDFGTGFASIGFLRQFRFDTLKIDRSLIADSASDPGAQALVSATIAVARALNMTTVAEGIENEAQALLVRLAGCDAVQGWHYGRAEGVDAVDALFAETEAAQKRA